MRKIPATFHGSVVQAVGGMMFIVAVLMLAFLIFVHELGHSLSLKRMIATHKKALFKSYGYYLFKRRVGSGCFWGH
ncbi:hypothetical protein [Helicobacter pylori]|uniref:hypothetical protein n=1 Tax=Helicobacter pylori TaxID=210 RepID=UPI0018A6B3FC